jgi:BirA family transcriptional regulator, biotin operon repressor / biotin---[acetyl-CoA-carboxylase] ligase
MTTEALEKFFVELAHNWEAPAAAWPPDEDPQQYGLVLQGDQVAPVAPCDPLVAADIRSSMLPAALSWLRDLKVLPVTGSTNLELMHLAQQQSVGGCVWIAEVQLQGRGRRGRTWFSPFGGNLAVSIGFDSLRPMAGLGGASLVVGLAVVDALEQLGIPNLSLKWPNDVLMGGAKLGGILVEMTTAGSAGVQLVVGVGLNVALP